MSFRQEMSGIALAVIAGAWASVAVGQGQGPGIESLLLPDPDPAPAAKAAEPAATKPAEKASEPEAAKPATGKYKIVKTIKRQKTAKYVKKKLRKGKKYFYKVKAFRTIGGKTAYSRFSNISYKKAR